MRIPDYPAAVEYLFRRLNFERTPARRGQLQLQRMRELLRRLDDPQQAFPVLHIAGTKGKGSVATMLSAALHACGWRTGLYTSPHLVALEERWRVDGRNCQQAEFLDLLRAAEPAVTKMDRSGQAPTFFELATALALLHFQRQQVDIAVLETGMGGRLDSTNVCQPLVSVITSISLDHTRQLGATTDLIAAEKCGIIKPGRPVVSGVLEEPARGVVRATAAERGCRLWELGADFHAEDIRHVTVEDRLQLRFGYRKQGAPARHISLRMPGSHQAANAALALATLDLLPAARQIRSDAVQQGLAACLCPARIEQLSSRPLVVLDAAHNLASAEALLAALGHFSVAGRRRLVFATSRDKDAAGMLRLLLPRFDQVTLTRFLGNPRTVPPAELLQTAQELGDTSHCQVVEEPSAAWRSARVAADPQDLICVAGSFFLAAELRDEIRRELGLSPRTDSLTGDRCCGGA